MTFTYNPHLAYHKIVGILATLTLCGCFDREAALVRSKAEFELVATTNIGLPPNNAEQLIKQWGDNNLKDPISAIYSQIGTPYKAMTQIKIFDGSTMQRVVYRVYGCINSKNSYGGYAGKQFYIFDIDHGHIINALEIGEDYRCTKAQ